MADKSKSARAQKQPINWANWFKRGGWALGLAMSILFPYLYAPLGLTLPFKTFGTISAIAGFALVYRLTPGLSKRLKILWTVLPVVVGGIAAGVYRSLLLSSENTTPDVATEWMEFGLFCLTYFCIFAVIGSAYRNGGAVIIQKFGKISIPSN